MRFFEYGPQLKCRNIRHLADAYGAIDEIRSEANLSKRKDRLIDERKLGQGADELNEPPALPP